MDGSFQELREKLDARQVLSKLGLEYKRLGDELRLCCPMHNEKPKKGQAGDLAINTITKLFVCHSAKCGKRGDIVELYAQLKGLNNSEALEELKSTFALEEVEPFLKAPSHQKESDSNFEMKELWENSKVGLDHGYLKAKKVALKEGYKVCERTAEPTLLIPFCDIKGNLKTLQKIFFQDGKFRKFFSSGCEQAGSFCTIGNLEKSAYIYVTEGFATAATLYEAFNSEKFCAVASGSATTQLKVAEALKQNFKDKKVIVALDADQAEKAKDYKEFECVVPRFTDDEKSIGCKDFNDYVSKLGRPLSIVEKIATHFIGERKIAVEFLDEFPVDFTQQEPPKKPVLIYQDEEETKDKAPLIHKGIIAMLVGEGGVGKTHFVANLAYSVATCVPFLGKFEIESQGGVCLILGEESLDDIHRLIKKTHEGIKKVYHQNKSKAPHQKLSYLEEPFESAKRLFAPISVRGISCNIIDDKGNPTPFLEELKTTLVLREPRDGWALIVIDPISRFAGAEAEKNNAIATRFISELEDLSSCLKGKPTILITHHKSKTGIYDSRGQSDARGSSAFTDGVRWQANLSKETPDRVRFEVTKTNYTRPIVIELKKTSGCLSYERICIEKN